MIESVWRRRVAVAGVGAVCAMCAPSATFGVETTPHNPDLASSLEAVTMVPGTTDIWALGLVRHPPANTPKYTRQVLHRKDGVWSARRLPTAFGLGVQGIAAGGPHRIWAVGSALDARTTAGPYIAESRGGRFTRVQLHEDSTKFAELTAVSASSGRNAWAVGTINRHPYALHWDGEKWARSYLGVPGSRKLELTSVSTSGPRNTWALGRRMRHGTVTFSALRWDGTSWAIAHTWGPASGPYLQSIATGGPNRVFVAGDAPASSPPFPGATSQSYIASWNGSEWDTATLPSSGEEDLLTSVDADATTAVAVGVSIDDQQDQKPLAMRMTPDGWVVEPTQSKQNYSRLDAVATSEGESVGVGVWAPNVTVAGEQQHRLVETSTGGSWQRIKTGLWR